MTLPSALIGFGQIGQGYSTDVRMSQHFRYSTHAQVLRAHPAFEWLAVVDISADALKLAQSQWQIQHVASNAAELACRNDIEFAVLATPPHHRLAILESFPALKAVLVEKPLGDTLEQCQEFLTACRQRNILVQVNLLRRADESMLRLANGELLSLIGTPQIASVVYGNGLLNNGTHMIDLIRMLLGEVDSVSAVPGGPDFEEGPLDGDRNFGVNLRLTGNVNCSFQPISFKHYRENFVDVWGTTGRLSITQEGLVELVYELADNRALENSNEIVSEAPIVRVSSLGDALYNMYNNVHEALSVGAALLSPGESALITSSVVQAAFESRKQRKSFDPRALLGASRL